MNESIPRFTSFVSIILSDGIAAEIEMDVEAGNGPQYAHDSCHDVEHDICQIVRTCGHAAILGPDGTAAGLAKFGFSARAAHKAVIIPF